MKVLARLQPAITQESAAAALLRITAATLALAAGVLHLAQIGPHLDEDPRFGLFFLVVGTLQIAGGFYLLYPIGTDGAARWVAWFGIVGTLSTIGIWAISRAVGLPFGAEPGTRESVGLADAAADVFEFFTVLFLLAWVHRTTLGSRDLARVIGMGMACAFALAAVWLLTRALGWFDPDPRLVAYSELTDFAALGFLALLGLVLTAALFSVRGRPLRHVVGGVLLGSLVLSELALVGFTLPAPGGQNRDCAYGPIREDSGLSHAQPPDPTHMEVGEVRSVVALLLVACAGDPVTITSLAPYQELGPVLVVERLTIDRTRAGRDDRVRAGAAQGISAVGAVLQPGEGRFPVVVQLRGGQPGTQSVAALKIVWSAAGTSGSLGFASSILVCVGATPCPAPSR